jgi:hypothetical protein
MNLFRAEETVYQWSQTNAGEGGGLMRVAQIEALFAGQVFRRRLEGDYLAHIKEYRAELGPIMANVGLTGAAFMPPRDKK